MMKVTVICLAYNHEAYIRDALEGFVRQQTDFPFEVLVHDDASTDGTAAIIREYAARYPGIIRPVFEQENQYSKGVAIPRDILFPLIRGRYIALCEGDDYWTDPLKLSKQVAALEAHPEVDLCAHRAQKERDGRVYGFQGPGGRTRVISPARVIWEGGYFVATCSLLCRREAYLMDTPFRRALFIDYTLQIQGSLRGGLLYMKDCMAVHRRGVPHSWTVRHQGRDKAAFYEKVNGMLDALNNWTQGHYAFVIRARKLRTNLHNILRKRG